MSAHWQQQSEGGGRYGFSLLRTVALASGRRFARLWVYPLALYYFLRRGPERRASRAYLTRALGRPATTPEIIRHLRYFGETLLDRIFLLARGERDFDIEVHGLDALEASVAQGRGVLLVGSHQGSFEVLRALSARCPHIPLRVLLDKQKTPAMTALLESLAPDVGAAVIDVSEGGAGITLAVAETCQAGGMVALLADRGRAHESFRHVNFLGTPAPLPIGPWLLAHALQVPVVLCFGIYEGGNRYVLTFEPFADPVDVPRDRRAKALDAVMSRYAQRLEHYARLAPYNWFNFYDFWRSEVDAVEAVPTQEPLQQA